MCVCVCAYIHTQTHSVSPSLIQQKKLQIKHINSVSLIVFFSTGHETASNTTANNTW